ncbi:MAG: flagellar hook-length control protein FliK [Zetaproteobacteria bacterium]|nr:flagellar hook-length control protein FliK [Zetaproteobacteria bacterium]
MMNPLSQLTPTSSTSQKGESVASTPDAKKGVFASLMKTIQKHLSSVSENKAMDATKKKVVDAGSTKTQFPHVLPMVNTVSVAQAATVTGPIIPEIIKAQAKGKELVALQDQTAPQVSITVAQAAESLVVAAQAPTVTSQIAPEAVKTQVKGKDFVALQAQTSPQVPVTAVQAAESLVVAAQAPTVTSQIAPEAVKAQVKGENFVALQTQSTATTAPQVPVTAAQAAESLVVAAQAPTVTSQIAPEAVKAQVKGKDFVVLQTQNTATTAPKVPVTAAQAAVTSQIDPEAVKTQVKGKGFVALQTQSTATTAPQVSVTAAQAAVTSQIAPEAVKGQVKGENFVALQAKTTPQIPVTAAQVAVASQIAPEAVKAQVKGENFVALQAKTTPQIPVTAVQAAVTSQIDPEAVKAQVKGENSVALQAKTTPQIPVTTAQASIVTVQTMPQAPVTAGSTPMALFQNESENTLLNQNQVAVIKKAKVSGEVLAKLGVTAHVPSKAIISNGVQTSTIGTVIAQGVSSSIDVSAKFSDQSSDSKDDRGSSRQVASLLDGLSIRDVRSTQQTFSAHLAYRTAQAFMPQDAMSEVARAAKEGMKKLELQLEPASLGKIQVTLQMDAAKQLQVHMVIDQSASKQILEQQLPQLRQALADQGLNLSGFTMDMNSRRDQSSRDEAQGFARQNGSGMGTEQVDLAAMNAAVMGVNTATHGRLNILA